MSIKLIHEKGPFGDATSLYSVSCPKDTTVDDIISHALTQREWGYVEIRDNIDPIHTIHRLEYKGATVVSDNIPDSVRKQKVSDCRAYGGWTRMDYIIKI